MEMENEPSVTVKDAMRLTGYSLRQIDRFIADGVLKVVGHQKHQQRKISRASIEAFNEARGYCPVDEVDQLKQDSLKHMQVTGEILAELQAIKTQVADLERLIKCTFAELETKIHAQVRRRSQGSTPADPDGAIMLIEFAGHHGVAIGKLRSLVERDPTLATVIERPDAKEKKKRWMIVPAQMAPMLAALEKHGVAYTRCPGCPHNDPNQVQEPQEERD